MYIGWEEPCSNVARWRPKTSYRLDHINSSRYNVFMERPGVVEAFNQDARRFGICSYGFSEDEFYNWRFSTT